MSFLIDMLKVERKFGYLNIVFSLALLLLFYVCVLFFKIYDKYVSFKNKNFIKTNATIKKINSIDTKSFFGIKYYNCNCNITYKVGRKVYNNTKQFSLSFNPNVGDIGEILYDPTDPNIFTVVHPIIKLLSGVTSLIFTKLGIISSLLIIGMYVTIYIYRNNYYIQTIAGLQFFGYLYSLIKFVMLS